jgi:hypothetical protein
MNELYFILNLPYENLQHSLNVCKVDPTAQKYTLDGVSKVALVTTQERIINYLIQNPEVSYNTLFPPEQCGKCDDLKHMCEMTSGPEWQEAPYLE